MALVGVNLKELAKEWKGPAYICAVALLLISIAWAISLIRCDC